MRAHHNDDPDCDWGEVVRFLRRVRARLPRAARPRRREPERRVKPSEYIGFVPTPMRVVRRMLELAEIQPGETVYDLGCGDGRILISAARKYGAFGVGIEIDRDRIQEARRRAEPFPDRITFRRQNVFDTGLRRADVVMIYLLPTLNAKLMPRLRRLKPGVRIVSHSFELPGVKACKTARVKCPDGYSHDIFVYRTPLRKA